MQPDNKKFKATFRIGSFDTDFKNKAKLTSICNFLQETAGMHADLLKWGILDLLKNNQSWVLSRLKIEVYRFPRWLDDITIETWPTGVEGLFCNRDFKIYNAAGELIMTASSSWLIVNFVSKRPVRPLSIISTDDLTANDNVFPSSLSKLKIDMVDSTIKNTQVQYSDLDLNQHVNNVKYVKWVIDACEFDFIKTHLLESIEINFMKEAKHNDNIAVYRSKLNNNYQHFEIRNNNEEKLHCTAIIKWKKEQQQ